MNRMLLGTLVLLLGTSVCPAQSGRPITSLPKPQGTPSDVTPAESPAQSLPTTNSDAATPAPAYTPPAASAPIPAMGTEVLKPSATAPAGNGTPVMAPNAGTPTYAQPGQSMPEAPSAASAPVTMTPHPTVTAPAEAPYTAPAAPVEPTFAPAPLRGMVLATTPASPEDRVVVRKPHFGPGSAIAVQLKAGFAGGGIDIATPLAQRLNFRVGASFFQYSGSYDIDGTHIDGEAKFRSATVQFDIFPFGNGFRISPGVTVYNGNNLNAKAFVPLGQNFDLGDDTYVSGCDNVHIQCATADPKTAVNGAASMTFGDRTAPSLTIGWGNMIPRSNRHISFPFEIGVQYIKDPAIHLNLDGVVCGSSLAGSGCASIQTNAEAQQSLHDEENDINNAIRPLRFYPILSIGVAWAFHIGQH